MLKTRKKTQWYIVHFGINDGKHASRWLDVLCAAALHAEAEADIRGVCEASVELFLSDVCKSSVLCLIVQRQYRETAAHPHWERERAVGIYQSRRWKEVQVCVCVCVISSVFKDQTQSTHRATHTPRPYLDYNREPRFATHTIVHNPAGPHQPRAGNGPGNGSRWTQCVTTLYWKHTLLQT